MPELNLNQLLTKVAGEPVSVRGGNGQYTAWMRGIVIGYTCTSASDAAAHIRAFAAAVAGANLPIDIQVNVSTVTVPAQVPVEIEEEEEIELTLGGVVPASWVDKASERWSERALDENTGVGMDEGESDVEKEENADEPDDDPTNLTTPGAKSKRRRSRKS